MYKEIVLVQKINNIFQGEKEKSNLNKLNTKKRISLNNIMIKKVKEMLNII